MGKGSKPPSWTIPEYTDPTYKTFSTPSGSTSYENNQFSYNPNQAGQDFQTQLDATRAAILKSMGGTDQATNDSLNQWQQTYMDEANRLSVPALSNNLFERGLGGSNYYAGSLNDLLSKNTNQAILNKYQLQNQDFNQNQTAFNNVNTAQNDINAQANNLLNLNANYANNQNQLNYDLYKTTLPYKAQFNAGKQGQGFGGIAGGIIGGIGGAFAGGPLGAVEGAKLGSSLGGGIDASQGYGSYGSQVYQPTLSALSMANLPSSWGTSNLAPQVSSFNNGNYSPFSSNVSLPMSRDYSQFNYLG